MAKLTIGSFKREGCKGSFQHYFTHILPDGKELCLEACTEGYCVALYDKVDGNIIGNKKCTQMGAEVEAGMIGFGFSMATGEALQKAVDLANIMTE